MISEEILIHFYIFPLSLLKDVNFAVYFSHGRKKLVLALESLVNHQSRSRRPDARTAGSEGRREGSGDGEDQDRESRSSIVQSTVTKEEMRTKSRLKKTGYSMPSWRFDRRRHWLECVSNWRVCPLCVQR